jgi:MFS family permease
VNFVGTLLLAYARNFGVMFLGRFIMGLGAGIAFMGPELYASEVSCTPMLPFRHSHVTVGVG